MELRDYSNILVTLADGGATEGNVTATGNNSATVFETSVDDGSDSV